MLAFCFLLFFVFVMFLDMTYMFFRDHRFRQQWNVMRTLIVYCAQTVGSFRSLLNIRIDNINNNYMSSVVGHNNNKVLIEWSFIVNINYGWNNTMKNILRIIRKSATCINQPSVYYGWSLTTILASPFIAVVTLIIFNIITIIYNYDYYYYTNIINILFLNL